MSEILAMMGGAFRDPGMTGTMPPPAPPTNPQLTPAEEAQFQQWIKTNKVPFALNPPSDFNLRGFWRAMMEGRAGRKPGEPIPRNLLRGR
jgi:hypothetical protein